MSAPTTAEVKAYLATHDIKDKLEAALAKAIYSRAADPVAAIAAALIAAPPALPPSESGAKKFFLGANWKCKIETKEAATALVADLAKKEWPESAEIVLFAPYLLLPTLLALAPSSRFAIGAQSFGTPGQSARIPVARRRLRRGRRREVGPARPFGSAQFPRREL